MAKKKEKSIDKIHGIQTVDPSHPKYYVVLRDKRRVSDSNHTDKSSANEELQFWNRVIQKFPDGTKMSIEECLNPNYVVIG